MSDLPTPDGGPVLDSVFAGLAHRDRRRVLGFLYERAPQPATRSELASMLTTASSAASQTASGETTTREMELTLQHTHLPKLGSAGLVEADADANTVRCTAHPAFQDGGIVDSITSDAPARGASRDALFRALADERRRTVLDVLSHQFHPIHLETLAREVGARERNTTEQAVPVDVVDQLQVSLRHRQLPILTDAALVSYDADEGTVEYEGHPELRVPWMHSVLGPDFQTSLTGNRESQEVGTIDGREDVISFGQSLGERADEELFCLFTHRDMLEAGCFTRIVEASCRGVDIYLATSDPTVREYVHENAPEVTIWDPKRDWLDLPVDGNGIGRLLMADREAVMLGTRKESTDTEIPDEKAIIGEGADNTLVVMVQQLLSRHLDRIDEQSGEMPTDLSL